jgi:hypothetical protein
MALKIYGSPTGGVRVHATDYKQVIKQLKLIDPTQAKQLKRRYREIGGPAQKSVRDEILTIGSRGPITDTKRRNRVSNGMLHGGRTGWGTNYGPTGGPVSGVKRYPYQSVLLQTLERAKKGQTGIVRLVVRSAATVLTDLAQNYRGRSLSRPYNIRLFGGPEISRQHKITYFSVGSFIRKLGAVKKKSLKGKSRNVYPGFDKSIPAVKIKAEMAIREAVKFIEANIDRINK